MTTRDLILEASKGPKIETLKKNRRPLSDEERAQVEAAGAVWDDGRPAVWKSVVDGKTWYVTNTHRCYGCAPSVKGAAREFHNGVKQSS